MKNLKKYVFILSIMATLSYASRYPGQFGAGTYLSGIKLIGGATDASIINPMVGLSCQYAFSERWTGEFAAGLGWVRPRTDNSYFQVELDAPYRTYLYPWNFNLRYFLNPKEKTNFYWGAGAGLTHWDLRKTSGDDKWFPIPKSGESVHGSQSNFSVTGFTGAIVSLSETFDLDMGIRYTHMLEQDLDNIGVGDANNGILEIRFLLSKRFGGYKDSDNDGVEDKYDFEPLIPEDLDGFQDEDGSPDYDNDNDGIPDLKDKAPDLPEDIDGFQDDDGAPDLDNDEDGIPDSQDKAPNAKEDFDGFQDDDGIPDPDNDNDGIIDSHDKCPNEPETINGYQDEDGCPDEKPGSVEFIPGQKRIFEEITFASGQYSIPKDAEPILTKIYNTLKNNPDIELEIRGYTDSMGKAASNLNLSQKRADSVKAYLVNKGIAFGRLKAIGYGEANPIGSNQTPAGRSLNRRIEFVRIEN